MVLDIYIGIIIQWGNEIQEVGPLPVPQKYIPKTYALQVEIAKTTT